MVIVHEITVRDIELKAGRCGVGGSDAKHGLRRLLIVRVVNMHRIAMSGKCDILSLASMRLCALKTCKNQSRWETECNGSRAHTSNRRGSRMPQEWMR